MLRQRCIGLTPLCITSGLGGCASPQPFIFNLRRFPMNFLRDHIGSRIGIFFRKDLDPVCDDSHHGTSSCFTGAGAGLPCCSCFSYGATKIRQSGCEPSLRSFGNRTRRALPSLPVITPGVFVEYHSAPISMRLLFGPPLLDIICLHL